MNIAFFHELSFGGASRTVDEYGRRLNVHHRVDLYTVAKDNQKINSENFRNVFSYSFYPKEWLPGNWRIRVYKDTIELIRLNSLHKEIAKEINKKDYDLVFVHPSQYTQAPFILKYLNPPTIYYCQEPLRIVYDEYLNKVDKLSQSRKIYELLNRWIRKRIDLVNIRHAQVILANSKFSQERIKQAYGKTTRVCYLGVNTRKFKTFNMKKKYDILFVGEREEMEGYNLLISAISYFKKKPTVKVISRTDGKVISDENLIAEYNKAKIVVALSKNEPFGLLPLEAMACGIPVVAVNEGGFPESVVDGRTGFLVKRDAKDLYKSISKLLTDEHLRKTMGKKAREYVVKNWTWEKSTTNLYYVIQQCILKK